MLPDTAWIDLGWVDLAMAAFLLVSTVAGLLRGFVFELMSLAGWFVAYLAVLWVAPLALPYIRFGPPGSALNHLVAVASVFLLTLLIWGLFARLVRSLIRATPLSGFDRLLGAGFGGARGLLVLMIVSLLVTVSPWARGEAWQRSRAAPWLDAAVQQLKPFLPFDIKPTSPGGTNVRHRWRDLQEPGQPVDL